MNQRTILRKALIATPLQWIQGFLCLSLLIAGNAMLAQDQSGGATAGPVSRVHATHILGLSGVPANATGNLSIEGDALQFQKTEGAPAQISISSIQDIALGTEDMQVGGVPLALGRAATPFGGGRAIALFSHKKFDTVTLEYVDSDGGLHGTIFRISKGKAQALKDALVAKGAHVKAGAQTTAQTAPEAKK